LSDARPFDDDGEVAPGVHALPVAGSDDGEVAYWLPRPRALVTAEVLLGTRDGLRFAESPALRSRDELRAWLRALDRLPVRLIIPSHGPPTPGGRAAIRAALARPPWGAQASA
jgi:glyoxylase-like metal-dependent hydrolase (beta-lactamase superfamily II)